MLTALASPPPPAPRWELHFTIPGNPSVKERHRTQHRDPRTGRLLDKPRHYTATETKAYERRVGLYALEAMARSGVRAYAGECRWFELELWIHLESRGSKDGDNIAKVIADGLQKVGGVFTNDVKLLDWRVHIRPVIALENGGGLASPCVLVTVRPSPFQGEFPGKPRKARKPRKAVTRA